MDKAIFSSLFNDHDVQSLKMLCYQGLILLLRSGGGTIKDLEKLIRLEGELGIEEPNKLAVAA